MGILVAVVLLFYFILNVSLTSLKHLVIITIKQS